MTFNKKLKLATHVRIVQMGTVKGSDYRIMLISWNSKQVWIRNPGDTEALSEYPIYFKQVDKPWIRLIWKSGFKNDV